MRSFTRTPGVALALLFTIALGIGGNVTVQGFVRGFTEPASPLASAGRMVSIFGRESGPLSYQEYLSVRSHTDLFEWLGAVRVSQAAIAWDGQSAVVPVAAVTSNLSGPLGLSLNKGVVLSRRLSQDGVGANRIRIEGVDTRNNGVAPEWLEGIYQDRGVDVWMPLPETGLDPNSRNLWVIGRLGRDVSTNQAQAAVKLRVLPYTGRTPEMAAGLARVGALLGLAAGAVFFIACANVASFLLGRAFARSHETALRVALGAGRGRLIRELLSDSIVISVAGGASGMLLAVWTSRVLPALLYEKDAARLVFTPDLFSIVAASATCIAITIACGLLPALAISHDRPVTVLRRESAGPSPAIRRLRLGLVIAQMASCCILVISTAALIDGLRAARVTGAGHRLGRTFLAGVQARPDVGMRYFQAVEAATKSIAGVSAVAWAGRLPGSQPAWRSFRIEPEYPPLREVAFDIAWLTPDSFTQFSMPPKAGRMFSLAEQGCRAAIVNEEAAKKLSGANTPGRTLLDPAGRAVEIIGVVATRKSGSRPTIYYDYTNRYGPPPAQITGARFRAPIAAELARAELDTNVVSPGYFDAMGLRVIEGQGFARRTPNGECRVGLVNQEAANLYFAGKAVGAAIIDEQGRRTAIIGVVHSPPLGTFQQRIEPAIYFPMSQDDLRRMTMIVQARDENHPTLAALRRKIESVPGNGPAPLILKTLDAHLTETSLAPLHIATMILGASATMALVLSVLGLFGALSDAARQRRRELAIRIALGAQRWRVVWQVLGEGGRLACAGAAAGMIGSLALSRWMTAIAPGGRPPALSVWLAAPLALAGAVAIASLLPARRALMVNPLMIMRDDN